MSDPRLTLEIRKARSPRKSRRQFRQRISEQQLQNTLHRAGAASSDHGAPSFFGGLHLWRRGDRAEGCQANVVAGISKIRPVQQVESLQSKLQAEAFVDLGVLDE